MSVSSPNSNGRIVTPAQDPLAYLDIGASGLRIIAGRVQEEFLPEIQGMRWWRVVGEMSRNDPVIAAVLMVIEMLARQVSWAVTPGTPDEEGKFLASFVEECLHDMEHSFPDVLAEILTMLRYGWAPMEVVFKQRAGWQEDPAESSKYDDGRVGWKKWRICAQDTTFKWEVEEDTGKVLGFWQIPPPTYRMRFVPAEKYLHFRTTTHKNNPQGYSILRGAYRPWYMCKQIENIEGIGIERDLAGMPVAWVPPEILSPGASAAQKQTLALIKKIVTNVRRDEQEGIVFPLAYDERGNKLFDFQLLSTGGSRQFNTGEVITRYKAQEAMAMLADFVVLGHEKVGSFALASAKTDLFITALGSFLDNIAAVITDFAIPKLLQMNGWRPRRPPTLRHGDIESIDLGELGLYVQRLAQTGMEALLDPEVQTFLLDQAGIPSPLPMDPEVWQAERMQRQKMRALTQRLKLRGLRRQIANPNAPNAPDAQSMPAAKRPPGVATAADAAARKQEALALHESPAPPPLRVRRKPT